MVSMTNVAAEMNAACEDCVFRSHPEKKNSPLIGNLRQKSDTFTGLRKTQMQQFHTTLIRWYLNFSQDYERHHFPTNTIVALIQAKSIQEILNPFKSFFYNNIFSP